MVEFVIRRRHERSIVLACSWPWFFVRENLSQTGIYVRGGKKTIDFYTIVDYAI